MSFLDDHVIVIPVTLPPARPALPERAQCIHCDDPWTDDEWDDRHSDIPTGEDVHARCCKCSL